MKAIFRAYDEFTNKMITRGFAVIGEMTMFGAIENYCIENPKPNTLFLERLNDIEVTQWTGLTDSKNNDVYNGDILSDGFDYYTVYWDEINCGFKAKSTLNVSYNLHYLLQYTGMDNNKAINVVGNIFEDYLQSQFVMPQLNGTRTDGKIIDEISLDSNDNTLEVFYIRKKTNEIKIQ